MCFNFFFFSVTVFPCRQIIYLTGVTCSCGDITIIRPLWQRMRIRLSMNRSVKTQLPLFSISPYTLISLISVPSFEVGKYTFCFLSGQFMQLSVAIELLYVISQRYYYSILYRLSFRNCVNYVFYYDDLCIYLLIPQFKYMKLIHSSFQLLRLSLISSFQSLNK